MGQVRALLFYLDEHPPAVVVNGKRLDGVPAPRDLGAELAAALSGRR